MYTLKREEQVVEGRRLVSEWCLFWLCLYPAKDLGWNTYMGKSDENWIYSLLIYLQPVVHQTGAVTAPCPECNSLASQQSVCLPRKVSAKQDEEEVNKLIITGAACIATGEAVESLDISLVYQFTSWG